MKINTLSYCSVVVFFVLSMSNDTANANVVKPETVTSAFVSFLDNLSGKRVGAKTFSFPDYNHETDICTVDYDNIKSEEGEVSIDVKLSLKTEGTGLMTLAFKDGVFAGLSDVRGWCVDLGRTISKGNYKFDVFSSLDTSGAIHQDAVDKPKLLPALNWLMNEIPTGTIVSIPDCATEHMITDQEYQLATWLVIDNATRAEVFDGWKKNKQTEDDVCVVDWLVQQAIDNQSNYEPNCYNNKGKIGLLLVVDDDEDNNKILNQVVLAEIDIRHVCTCFPISSSPSMPPVISTVTPTKSPTSSPTGGPTKSPTSYPTGGPTKSPTSSPTGGPTSLPTSSSTGGPTKSPTSSPTGGPTKSPTPSPTGGPSKSPTRSPTGGPTTSLTSSPTGGPTKWPTLSPTGGLTELPTPSPTGGPTKAPTSSPTGGPTKSSTSSPSPTGGSTRSPALSPTGGPTKSQTSSPTGGPTKSPTPSPTGGPTKSSTSFPTEGPTKASTKNPTKVPTKYNNGGAKTKYPTYSESSAPSPKESGRETAVPTGPQTLVPTSAPTDPDPETMAPTPKETGPQTLDPTSQPTTSTPSRAPSKSPSADPTRNQGANGDPHFKTWSGDRYDFHGICDLILLSNPKFNDNLGMDIYIRSKKTKKWSYISTAVTRIGVETFEVSGRRDGDTHWLNGIKGEGNGNDILWEEGANIAGYPITYRRVHSTQREYTIFLGGDNEKIVFKTWKDFVRIDVVNPCDGDFTGSLGLMGSYPNGESMGRFHLSSSIKDRNLFGQEWQVLATDPKLFHSVEGPQSPARCELPSKSSLRRRLSKSEISREDAEVLCSSISEKGEHDSCVFDVMATGDKFTANAY